MVIISEECAFRGETLIEIVNRISDLIQDRAKQGKNYGCILIPEGLLNHLAAYKHLINELSTLFMDVDSIAEARELATKLYENNQFLKESLTPWSYSLFSTIPDFIRKQILFEREIQGSIKLA